MASLLSIEGVDLEMGYSAGKFQALMLLDSPTQNH
jgi:hypothetical protein